MRIFIACNYLGGGGAERVAVILANGFVARGHEVFIIADLERYRSYQLDSRVKELSLHTTGIGIKRRLIQGVKNMRRYAKLYHPDVIIGNMHICSLISRIGTIGMKIPVILTIHHALESDTYHFSRKIRFLDRYTLWMYPAFTVLTHPDKDCLKKREKYACVMPNPLTFVPVEEMPRKENIIMASGRLDDWKYKGWDILIKTWSKIASKYPDWKVLIVGTGSESSLNFLKNMATEHHVANRIEFLGFRNDIELLYKKSSIFLLSSRSEGLPMVLIEAMSQGCAPVATDFKGRTREIITTDSEGLLANPEDVDLLSEHISRLIDDPALLRKIQRGAVERSKYYLTDHILDFWEEYLNAVVS